LVESDRTLSTGAHRTVLAALEVVPFAMLILNERAAALAVNQRWSDLSGLGPPDSVGAGWLSIVDHEERDRLRSQVVQVASTGGNATSDRIVSTGAKGRWTRWWMSRHELDGAAFVAAAVVDVDEDYARLEGLYHLATHDALTGLLNRNHFLECIEQALRRNQRAARRVGIVYVDLDDFKRVNDAGGHSLGDRVLYAIAARLRHAVRSADLVARIGGDEFAVLCEGLSALEQAEVVAQRIATTLAETVELDGERWSVGASVGAAVNEGVPDTPEGLIDRADRAMYSVKLTRRPQAAGTAATAVAVPASPRPPEAPAPSADARAERREAPATTAAPVASTTTAPAFPAGPELSGREAARVRLMEDVLTLRESIESIRRMLDGLLAAQTGVVDVREER
jgi:diguanylate cyclase (GGDEF)-like protein